MGDSESEEADEIEGDLITPNQKAANKRKRNQDFADLEEFSDILETSGQEAGKKPSKKRGKFTKRQSGQNRKVQKKKRK